MSSRAARVGSTARALRQRYEQLAEQAGFTLPADRLVGGMRVAEQQQVEILRALARDARMIVMDEPSAALSGPDVERLHEIIRSLAAQGKTVILVSHFLREVLELADTVTVLRDGRIVRTAAGRRGDRGVADPGDARPAAERRISAQGARARRRRRSCSRCATCRARGVDGVSFELREGEIVGLAGLVGAGRTELARAIFGADKRLGRRVELAGEPLAGSAAR